MIFELSATEKTLLLSLKTGFSRILIYRSGLYPSIVSFVLESNKTVTIGAKGIDLAPRFEIFPITVAEKSTSTEPMQVIEHQIEDPHYEISILQKSEWEVPSSPTEKLQMLGEPRGSTTQYEGKLSDIPDTAINQATLHAGVEIRSDDGWSFLVATSMFPYALYVSNCDFSESADTSIYDRIELR